MPNDPSSSGSFDAFKPEPQTGYSPDKFYTASTSKGTGGESARHPFTGQPMTFPTAILADIGALIARGTFPEYRTQADFFRDAVVHLLNLRKHQRNDPELVNRFNVFSALAEAQHDRLINESMRELIALRTETLKVERDPAERAKVVANIKRDLSRQNYPKKYRRELESLVEEYDG